MRTVPQMMRDVEGQFALARAADELHQRVMTVSDRQPCPRCEARVGETCRNLRTGRPIKHSHVERLRADGIQLR